MILEDYFLNIILSIIELHNINCKIVQATTINAIYLVRTQEETLIFNETNISPILGV